MPTFDQEWISPILEVYKKRKITERYTVILGLNPIGQGICREFYNKGHYETVLVFNSPSFSTWNRYPSGEKPPVIPVQGMVEDDLMLIFGDVFVKDYEWVTDMLFYLRGNVPTRFIIAFSLYDETTCGQVLTDRGERLLKRMNIPRGRPDFYDGLTAPLLSLGNVADIDPVVIHLESTPGEIVLQIGDIPVTLADIENAKNLLTKGLY
ncbi:MAG: hypothetical protein ACTSYL_11910 [Candidatus Thorarchaeota archaeon]